MSKQELATYLISISIPFSSIKEAESSVKNGRNTIWPKLPSPLSVEVSCGDFTGTKGEILVTFLAFGYFIPPPHVFPPPYGHNDMSSDHCQYWNGELGRLR